MHCSTNLRNSVQWLVYLPCTVCCTHIRFTISIWSILMTCMMSLSPWKVVNQFDVFLFFFSGRNVRWTRTNPRCPASRTIPAARTKASVSNRHQPCHRRHHTSLITTKGATDVSWRDWPGDNNLNYPRESEGWILVFESSGAQIVGAVPLLCPQVSISTGCSKKNAGTQFKVVQNCNFKSNTTLKE